MMTRVVAPDPPDNVPDLSIERCQSMAFAVSLHREGFSSSPESNTAVITSAREIFKYLTGAVTAALSFGTVTDQETGRDAGYNFGGSMSQLRVTDQVTFRVRTYDARQNEILDDPGTEDDNIRWSLTGGGESLVTLNVDEDTRGGSLVPAGTPGSTVLSAEITTADGVRTVTQAIDVIPGHVATMVIEMGEPTPQADPAPAEPGV